MPFRGAMIKPGRNEPCPCGSGRKFKHCHGRTTRVSESAGDRTWRNLRRVLDGYPSMMLRFVLEVYGPVALQEAWDEFLLWPDDDPEFDPETPHMQVFMPWFFHRWEPDPYEGSIEDAALHDRSPTSVLLEKRGRRLDPLLRRYLEGCARTPFSFHEIVRCEAGVGFRSRDMFAGEEWDVLERSASRTMQVGDLFFGQVVTCDDVSIMEACGPHPIPPVRKIELIELRERVAGGLHPPTPETLADWDIELREAYLDITESLINPPLPILQNTDGDDLAFHRISFETGSAQRAFDALKHLASEETESELLESADRDEEGRVQRVSFSWTVPGDRAHAAWDNVVLGHIEIDGTRIVANVNSAERAARFRSIMEERLGSDARHEGTEVQSVDDALEAERSGDGPPDPADDPVLADHPEVRQRLRELMSAHYEAWVSESIPALDGLTPLEAVRDPAGREKVEALIRQIERDGLRMKPPLDPAVLEDLRLRLGLD